MSANARIDAQVMPITCWVVDAMSIEKARRPSAMIDTSPASDAMARTSRNGAIGMPYPRRRPRMSMATAVEIVQRDVTTRMASTAIEPGDGLAMRVNWVTSRSPNDPGAASAMAMRWVAMAPWSMNSPSTLMATSPAGPNAMSTQKAVAEADSPMRTSRCQVKNE
ncbi:unannotated protein [freshwater metagenome]|uniref:Unannotated protein n=1 Tax=freshwater metagenome TaxID=449393 RepID=A0A6J7PME5_9ZZZZ